MTGIVEFLTARYAEEEADARAANSPEALSTGEHWHWVYAPAEGRPGDGVTDQPADLDAATEFVGDHLISVPPVSLRTVEEYPARSLPGHMLPSFVIWSTDEMPVGPARHIARHDPAWVLADVAARRAILDLHAEHAAAYPDECTHCNRNEAAWDTIRLLAQPYRGHPDFDPAWTEETA